MAETSFTIRGETSIVIKGATSYNGALLFGYCIIDYDD